MKVDVAALVAAVVVVVAVVIVPTLAKVEVVVAWGEKHESWGEHRPPMVCSCVPSHWAESPRNVVRQREEQPSPSVAGAAARVRRCWEMVWVGAVASVAVAAVAAVAAAVAHLVPSENMKPQHTEKKMMRRRRTAGRPLDQSC